ncbi:hypothetical protein, partial [Escherichia coli]|uniref:hypothetical protein n=1 Tax=Escherichia coli TaxID=562 RepID=UPI001BAF0A23
KKKKKTNNTISLHTNTHRYQNHQNHSQYIIMRNESRQGRDGGRGIGTLTRTRNKNLGWAVD